MAVDDAATLDRGGVNLEFGWSKDGAARGFEGVAGYGPLEGVEVEFSFGRTRDKGVSPSDTIHGLGAALKWVPLQAETGLSAGLKFEYVHENARNGADARVQALSGLLTWGFESGARMHANLGREWSRIDHAADENAATWGVGLELPVTGKLQLTVETFGASHARPDRQIGLRYEIRERLKFSGALRRGNDRHFANLGVAWEF